VEQSRLSSNCRLKGCGCVKEKKLRYGGREREDYGALVSYRKNDGNWE